MKMMSQFAVVGIFAIFGLCGLTQSVPLVEKDFFWFQTEDGKVVPAFLKERTPIRTEGAIEDDVIFWHYLPGQEEGRQILPNCSDNCLSGFIKGAPLMIGIHGFGSSHLRGFGINTRAGFAKRNEPFNLIYINWSKRAALPDYAAAVRNVPAVGEYAATLLNYLLEEGIATLDQTYWIGHSLGAHVANHVNIHVNGGKMRTIFACDPAWPLYASVGEEERLDPSDAQFVNVIHTSMGYLGFDDPIGHVDFYPNSGKGQPGCGLDLGCKCSHSRAYELIGESIGNPEAFPACKCTDWDEFDDGDCSCTDSVNMGWDTPRTAQGSYYLKTNGEAPFGRGSVQYNNANLLV